MLIVFSEAESTSPTSINGRELRALTEAARLLGDRIVPIPPDFSVCETAEAALAYAPEYEQPVPAVWVGFIPSPERYAAIYAAALAKNIVLLNTPEQHSTAMEFDRAYPLLGDLTPISETVQSPLAAVEAANRLGYPVFLKGAVKSNKEQGWAACVAGDAGAIERLTTEMLERTARARGRVIVRQIAALRQSGAAPGGFPLGREYRVFLYQNQVLARGYYWDEHADPFPLTPEDAGAINRLAVTAAQRVGVPFIAVDIAQLVDGSWIVIEVGDAQFSGLSHVPVLELWAALQAAIQPGNA